MGIYLLEKCVKDKNGRWHSDPKELVYAPHDMGRWHNTTGCNKSFVQTAPTRSGLNRKVVKTTNYFDNCNCKYIYDLITTSSKLSKKDKEKYSKVKNAKYF